MTVKKTPALALLAVTIMGLIACVSSASYMESGTAEPRLLLATVENFSKPTVAPPKKAEEPAAQTDVKTEEQCPITENEILMLAKVMTAEAEVLYWNGTRWGVTYRARQAAVGWIGLNRLDAGFEETLAEVLSAPHQFEYHEETKVSDGMLLLAEDIVQRWWAEKQGANDVGRTIPASYLFFYGDGRENYFREEFKSAAAWDWSLPDPYAAW